MANPWEKRPVDPSVDAVGVNPPHRTSYNCIAKVLALGLSFAASSTWVLSPRLPPLRLYAASHTAPSQFVPSDSCPKPTPITPNNNSPLIRERLLRDAATEENRNTAGEWLCGAIKIVCVRSLWMRGLEVPTAYDLFRTESYDGTGPVGPRWEVFGPFHGYLLGAFPLLYVSWLVCLAT
jgi:hypothetical protein